MPTLTTWDENVPNRADQTLREIVLSEVVDLVSRRRPLMSSIGSQSVDSNYFEVLTDSLGSRGLNAVLEGAAFTNPALTQPARHAIHVQAFAQWGIVSDEQRLVAHYNEDPYTYQVRKNLNELLNDVNFCVPQSYALAA